MTIIQAAILGILYCLYCGEIFVPWTYCWLDLMMVSLLTGLVLGDVRTGVIVGGTIQPMYLALTAVGGAKPVDKCAAGIISSAMVITQGISLEEALIVAAAASLIMAQLNTLNRVLQVWSVHRCDKCVATGNVKGLRNTIFFYGEAIRWVCFMLPMTLILKFGTQGLGFLMNGMPEWASNIFRVAGGLMPALGFAMVIMVIGKGALMPFFIFGFFFAQYTGLGSIPGVLMGAFLGWIYMVATRDKNESGSLFGNFSELLKSGGDDKDFWNNRLISKRTFKKVWFNWRLAICHVDNVERLQASGMAYTMAPALQELYPDDAEARIEGLKRHMEFFITENMIGGIIPGIVLSMEEERARGLRNNLDEDEVISAELINSVKTGVMGPLAGVGDTLNYATIKPVLTAFFMGFAQNGQVWAPIVYVTILYSILVMEGWFMYNVGYKLGTKSATAILRNNSIQKIITFFSVLGLCVMGVMAAQNVSVAFTVDLPFATETMSLQATLIDGIAPGLLPLGAVMATYAYLKKGGNVLKATLWMLVIAAIFGGLGIMG